MSLSDTSPYRQAWGLDVEADSRQRGRRDVAHGAPRRAAETFDGEVKFSADHDERDVPEHGDDQQWSNETTDLPEPLQKPRDGVATDRSPSGFPHGSRAASKWLKCDVPADKHEQFARLYALQHDKMGVRDSESDCERQERREMLWADLTNLGLRGTDRQRAYRLATTDEYRTSSWARHYGGFVGLAIGYAAVVAFDSEADARDAILGDCEHGGPCDCDDFREVATTIMETADALGAVRYAFERFEER